MAVVILRTAFIFLVVWWLVFLMVLPFGSRPPEEVGSGHAASAPESPQLKKKIIITTVLAALVSMLLSYALGAGWISYKEI